MGYIKPSKGQGAIRPEQGHHRLADLPGDAPRGRLCRAGEVALRREPLRSTEKASTSGAAAAARPGSSARRCDPSTSPVLGASASTSAPEQLSGGMSKQDADAGQGARRPGPDLLVLDETAATGSGPAVISSVGTALKALRAKHGCTILMVEQNLDLSLDVADNVAVLKLGSLTLEKPADAPGLRDEPCDRNSRPVRAGRAAGSRSPSGSAA